MMRKKTTAIALSSAVLLSACVSQPTGPTGLRVYPPPNKPPEVFFKDQSACKAYADQETAGQADKANEREFGAAAIGTALGAGLGAAVGGGRGAAIGAAGGAVVGTGVGTSGTRYSQLSIQAQYNEAYSLCMTAYGNTVQNYVPFRYVPPMLPPPPPPGYYPPGYYPPPPPPPPPGYYYYR
jgi:hypothetical protein